MELTDHIPVTSNPLVESASSEYLPSVDKDRTISFKMLETLKRSFTKKQNDIHDVIWLEHLEKEAPSAIIFMQFMGVIVKNPFTPKRWSFRQLLISMWALGVRCFLGVSIFASTSYMVHVDFERTFGKDAAQMKFYFGMSSVLILSSLPNFFYIMWRLRSKCYSKDSTAHIVASLRLATYFCILVFFLFILAVPSEYLSSWSGEKNQNLTSSVYSSSTAFPMAASLIVFIADVKAAKAIVSKCVEDSKLGQLTFTKYLDARDSIKDRVKDHNISNGFLILVAAFNSIAIVISMFFINAENAVDSVVFMLGTFATFGKELLLLVIALLAVVEVNEASDLLTLTIGDSELSVDVENGQRILSSQLVHPILFKVLGVAPRRKDIKTNVAGLVTFIVLASTKLVFQPGESLL